MKFFSMAALVLFSSTAQSFEILRDGCYQTHQPGSLNIVVCVSGTMEEGIGGAGVRAVIVGTNSSDVLWCGVTTSMAGSEYTTLLFGDQQAWSNERTDSRGQPSVKFLGFKPLTATSGKFQIQQAGEETYSLNYTLVRELGYRFFQSELCDQARRN